jgi:hypothetical protein
VNPQEWIRRLIMPRWVEDRAPQHDHPHWRRFTAKYRRKRSIVKNVWIVSGLVMALEASPAIIVAMALGTTFLSFVILDETP